MRYFAEGGNAFQARHQWITKDFQVENAGKYFGEAVEIGEIGISDNVKTADRTKVLEPSQAVEQVGSFDEQVTNMGEALKPRQTRQISGVVQQQASSNSLELRETRQIVNLRRYNFEPSRYRVARTIYLLEVGHLVLRVKR